MAIDPQPESTSSLTRSCRFHQAWIWGILVLISFVPRAWLCYQREVISSDAVVYMDMADAFERGNWDKALGYLNLNIFPPLLVALRHTGLEWTTAGAWWSVVFSSLAVLPLFGLFRRMFDERVAFIAGLLYAAHPCLITYSPWMLRDPTHWFLFILTLYLIWRAMAEARWRWFISAGAALTLAVHLRSEAWLLMLPLLGWALWQWFKEPSHRWRIAGGTLVCLATIPTAIIAVNLTVLANHTRWEWGCMRHIAVAQHWASAASAPSHDKPSPALETKRQAKQTAPKRLKFSTFHAMKKVAVRMVKAFTYAYALLALISLWIDRRELLKPKDLPLTLVCLVLFLGLTIHLAKLGNRSVESRYFLIIIMLALPRVARGAILVSQAAATLLKRTRLRSVRPDWVLACLLSLVLLGGFVGGWNSTRHLVRPWEEQAMVGKWILATFGPEKRIGCNIYGCRLVVHYSQGKNINSPSALRHDSLAFSRTIRKEKPDVIVLWENGDLGQTQATHDTIMQQRKQLGYHIVASPLERQAIRVLARDDTGQ